MDDAASPPQNGPEGSPPEAAAPAQAEYLSCRFIERGLVFQHSRAISDAATMPADLRSRWLSAGLGTWVAHTAFIFLVAVDVTRTLHHPMWRDEFETYWIAVSSPSFPDLLANMKYTAHPALLYITEWLVTRLTPDPMWIQVMQIGLALGVWLIVYLWSPFSRLQKLLLLLSYFLFWEYFVISRNYVLIALIAFAYIALRQRRPRSELALWLLLGLLANAHAYAAIWSIVLAAMLVVEELRSPSIPKYVPVAGGAVYLALLAFAIVMMEPPPEYALSSPMVRFAVARSTAELYTPIGAFVPFDVSTIRDAIAYIADPATAKVPDFFSADPTNEFIVLTHADTDHPVRLALVFAAPVALCWLLARNVLLVVEFSTVYVGILLFENIWSFPGSARHHGIVFLALIAAVWAAWSRRPPAVWSRWLFGAVLLVNACGGVLSLASELRPFSESYETAAWIRQNGLADAFLIGSHDAQVSTVIGYLRRPVYYLECECFRPFGIWDPTRHGRLTPEKFASRLAKAVTMAGQRDAILIRNRPVTTDDLAPGASNLTATRLKAFTNASTDENFWVYRLSRAPPAKPE
jgi:hypothetical protein